MSLDLTKSEWSTLTTFAVPVSSSSLWISNDLAVFFSVLCGSAIEKGRCTKGNANKRFKSTVRFWLIIATLENRSLLVCSEIVLLLVFVTCFLFRFLKVASFCHLIESKMERSLSSDSLSVIKVSIAFKPIWKALRISY